MTKPKKPKDKLERAGSVNFEPPKEWEKYQKELGQFKASIEARQATPAPPEGEENAKRLADSVKQHVEELEALNLRFKNLFAGIKLNPNSDGWIRLCEILIEAKKDKRIISSAGARCRSVTAMRHREYLENATNHASYLQLCSLKQSVIQINSKEDQLNANQLHHPAILRRLSL